MKIFSTYKARITNSSEVDKACNDTTKKYQDALAFILSVVLESWDTLEQVVPAKNVSLGQARQCMVERLIHKTKTNPSPAYPEFDARFYKFPSYMRRAAITEAIGMISSYKSNLTNWEENGKKGKRPRVPSVGRSFPAMYRGVCFIRTGQYTASIKVYVRNTWDWTSIDFRKSDMDYFEHHCQNRKLLVPTLRKRGHCWSLDFSFEERVNLKDGKPLKKTVVLGVDMGINSPCVCSVMTSDGTILGRCFCNLPREQDLLSHWLNKIKKSQRHGGRKNKLLWARVNHIRKEIAVKVMQFIVNVAAKYDVDVIVFERLNFKGRKRRGKWAQRLSLWQVNTIQKMVADNAHRLGMHITRVCPWGTSKLAFDGSGEVSRDDNNHALCTFANGKRYNCDLSASYNIAARYYIREIIKPLPEKARLDIQAKVPECSKRTACTLATLINLNAALAPAGN